MLHVLRQWEESQYYFNQQAGKDINRAFARYEARLTQVPAEFCSRVPTEEVEDLLRQYIYVIHRNPEVLRRVLDGDISIEDILLDFAGTIGCEAAVRQNLCN